jgi:hypothetical protein
VSFLDLQVRTKTLPFLGDGGPGNYIIFLFLLPLRCIPFCSLLLWRLQRKIKKVL